MKKKLWVGVLAMVLALLLPCGAVFAEPMQWEEPEPLDMNTITAEYAMLFDLDSGTVLASKNTGMRLYPASTTKILTALLALEYGDLDQMCTVSENAITFYEDDVTTIDLRAGETVPLRELLYAALVKSANDAANVIAETSAAI